MKPALAIVVYRCEVAGRPTDSLDIQVRYFADSAQDIAASLRAEPECEYTNHLGELVRWPFVRLLAVEEFENPVDGDEIVGFIAQSDEFTPWLRPDA